MNRDKQALSYLYDKYGDALYGIAFRIVGNEDVTKEVVQDVFLKIWNKIGLYDASKGRFFTWMLNLTRNEAIDKVRSKEIRKSSKTNSIDNYVYKDPDMNTQSQVESIGVRELMNDLDEDQQFVLKRVYFEGFSHSEVSKEFNIPLGTVKTRLRAALKNLRKKKNI
jgi:RNA polymerase sigma-70 factor (ECF subfamily)